MKKCAQLIIDLPDCMELLKRINLNIHKIQENTNIQENTKFRRIIDQTGTAAQVITNFLKPLCKNEYTVNESFFQELTTLPSLEEDEEDVSYDVESLFTNIPVTETIDNIKDQIYVQKKLTTICTNLIFKRLLLKVDTE